MEELSAQDYRILHEFRYSIRRFLHFSEQAARAAGIEPQQHQLLLAVKGLPEGVEPTIAAIAERLQVRHHSAVELVDRLVARGLVVRERGEADRRQVLVRLTTRGEAILHELSVHHRTQLRTSGPALAQVLQRIIENESGGSAEDVEEVAAHHP